MEPLSARATNVRAIDCKTRPRAWSIAWEAELEAATSPAQLVALDLRPVSFLAARLQSYGEWSPLARVAFAFRAGYGARLVLAGQRNTLFAVTGQSGVPNRYYIVLRGAPSRRMCTSVSDLRPRTLTAGWPIRPCKGFSLR